MPLQDLIGKVATLYVRVDLSSRRNARFKRTDINTFVDATGAREIVELIVDLETKKPGDTDLVHAIHTFLGQAATDHCILLDSTGCALHPPLTNKLPSLPRQPPAKKGSRNAGPADE